MKALLLAALLFMVTTVPQVLAGSSQQPQPRSSPSIVLGHLETQHHVVTIYAGNRATYTVRTEDGKVLADKIAAHELRAQFPELAPIDDATTVAWAGL